MQTILKYFQLRKKKKKNQCPEIAANFVKSNSHFSPNRKEVTNKSLTQALKSHSYLERMPLSKILNPIASKIHL